MKEILYFSASWCQPCRTFGPVMNELSLEGINIRKIDVDNSPEITRKYNIRSVPTCVFVKNGKTVKSISGAVSKQQIQQTYKGI